MLCSPTGAALQYLCKGLLLSTRRSFIFCVSSFFLQVIFFRRVSLYPYNVARTCNKQFPLRTLQISNAHASSQFLLITIQCELHLIVIKNGETTINHVRTTEYITKYNRHV
ncbi:hypothetical protein CW304_23940 [Bacillus sp. UFRGS-B20]|nr:hypothetical protein CW304_23940 [Bacillus sp. UFRGS-B20]